MDLNRIPDGGRPLIQGYGDRGFRISGERIDGAVLVLPEGFEPLGIDSFEDIGAAQVQRLTELDETPDILLIGSGAGPLTLPGSVRGALTKAGIAVEVMGTGAACRTYNVLVGEGRHVAAILVPVD